MAPPLNEFGRLLEALPTGQGPAMTSRRETIWNQVKSKKTGTAPQAALDAGLQYVQELERSLPAGSRPLVMHGFHAAMSVATEFSDYATDERAESGELFRLVLLAMRRYIELYAHLAGPQSRARPLAVTQAEFEHALPLLKQWGMTRLGSTATASFAGLDPQGVGVIRFDDFAKWVMRTQMQQLSGGAPLKAQPHVTPSKAAAAKGGDSTSAGPLRELNTLAMSIGGVEQTVSPKRAASAGSTRHGPRRAEAGSRYGTDEHKLTVSSKSPPRQRPQPHLPSTRPGPNALTATSHPRSTIPVRPRSSTFDLVERLSDVGLTQYARKLSALGFDDVRQLLALQHSVDARDGTRLDLYESGYSSVLDQLNLMPGHRIKMLQFFQNESRNAARAAHERLMDDANERARDVAAAESRKEHELSLLRQRNQELEEEILLQRDTSQQAEASARIAWARSERSEETAKVWLGQGKLVQVGDVQVVHASYDRILRPVVDEWRDLSHGRRKARRFLRRLMNRSLAIAFGKWADVSESIYRLRSIGLRWSQRALAKAFDTWYAAREAGKGATRIQTTMERFVKRLANAKLAAGWTTWRQGYLEAKAARERMRGVAGRLANPGVSKAFDRWSEMARSRREKRAKMFKALKRNTSEGKAFHTWIAYVEPYLIFRRAARALTNVPVRKAWNSWAALLDAMNERQRQMDTARNVLGKLAHRGQSRAWEAWVELVSARHEAWALLDKVTRRWLLLEAHAAWSHWRELTDGARRKDRLMRSFGSRLMSMEVSRAWSSWVEFADARRLRQEERAEEKARDKGKFLPKTRRRLWGLEHWLASLLWSAESTAEHVLHLDRKARKTRRRAKAADEDSEDEGSNSSLFGDDDDLPFKERRRMRRPIRIGPDPDDELPAMDGPYARRRAKQQLYGADLRAREAEDESSAYMHIERYGGNVVREIKRPSWESRRAARGSNDDGAGTGLPPRRRPAPPPDAGWSGDPSGYNARHG